MQVMILRGECGHLLYGDFVNSLEELTGLIEELQGATCHDCGGVVNQVDVVTMEAALNSTLKENPTWSKKNPLPRTTKNVFDQFRKSDIIKAEEKLRIEGGVLADNLLEPGKTNTLNLLPSDSRKFLEMIPVGLLNTFDPNASCILFKDCSIPVIVLHSGPAQFTFYMNRIIIPAMEIINQRKETLMASTVDIQSAAYSAMSVALSFLGVYIELPNVRNLTPLQKTIEFHLTTSMKQFVLAHEYGHAVLGHNIELTEMKLSSVDKPTQYYQRVWQQEFEADAWAQDVLCGAFTETHKKDQVHRELPW